MHLSPFSAATIAGLAMSAGAAMAINAEGCGSPAEINAKMKAEGQQSILTADEVSLEDQSKRGMIFTANRDGSVGYVVRSDKAMGEATPRLCVHSRLASLRFYDARKPGTPAGALLPFTQAQASHACDVVAAQGKVLRKDCDSMDAVFRRNEAYNVRPVLQGIRTIKNEDGSYRLSNVLLTVSANMVGIVPKGQHEGHKARGDILGSSMVNGASAFEGVLMSPQYTTRGLELLQAK